MPHKEINSATEQGRHLFIHFFLSLRVAIQFLSILPVGKLSSIDNKVLGASLYTYPLVGLLLGGLLFCLGEGILMIFSGLLAAGLILACWVFLTGALHLDGLADSADAWMGGLGSRERTLRIMKDPASGPVAVCVLMLILLIKLFAIEALCQTQNLALILWPLVIARAAAPLLIISTDYARGKGLASALSQHSKANGIWLVTLISAVIITMSLGWQGIVLLVISALSFFALRFIMIARIKGYTGDTLGALIELIELVTLLSLVALFV